MYMNLTNLSSCSSYHYRESLDTLIQVGHQIGVLAASQASQDTMKLGRPRGHQVQVIGVLSMSESLENLGTSHRLEVNQASQDIMTLPRGVHIHGLSLHGHIHHGQLIG